MKKYTVGLVLALTLCGCAASPGSVKVQSDQDSAINDPWEGLNRDVYRFNKAVDKAVLKPVAEVYQSILPSFVQRGITNFFNNIRLIPTIANDVLQLKVEYAAYDIGRLLINTSFGIGGLFDVATNTGVEAHYEDFGQTLAHWGLKQSRYLVLPFIGSTTARDGFGMAIDTVFLSPWGYIDNDKVKLGLMTVNVIDDRANLLSSEKAMKSAAIDEYTFVRDAYLQRRNHQILDGQLPEDDDFEEYDEY